MTIGITSIQKNRNPWILEWLAFHMLMGVDSFYIYAHQCTDGMVDTLLKLSNNYPINVFAIDTNDSPQLAAYQHSWNTHGKTLDWMAFIDGDEFLFPTQSKTISDALSHFEKHILSALGVYWVCYGSNGHMTEPDGLIIENYPRHSSNSFYANRHIKSILRGGQNAELCRSHLFNTELGTFDEKLRPITHGLMSELEPSYEFFRINHYVTQSYGYFKNTKQNSGQADLPTNSLRPDDWFFTHDRNECDDGVSYNFLIRLKIKVMELRNAVGMLAHIE
jgi:hypothetical protein